MESTLKVGDTAPDFSLPATTKDPLSLSGYRGRRTWLSLFMGWILLPAELKKYPLGKRTTNDLNS